MDLAHGFDDIVTSIKTVFWIKYLHVTALFIELEYVYLIFFNDQVYIVCGKAYKSLAWCHDMASGLDIVFNSEHYYPPFFTVQHVWYKCDLDHPTMRTESYTGVPVEKKSQKRSKSVEKCDKVQRNVAIKPLSRLTLWSLGYLELAQGGAERLSSNTYSRFMCTAGPLPKSALNPQCVQRGL